MQGGEKHNGQGNWVKGGLALSVGVWAGVGVWYLRRKMSRKKSLRFADPSDDEEDAMSTDGDLGDVVSAVSAVSEEEEEEENDEVGDLKGVVDSMPVTFEKSERTTYAELLPSHLPRIHRPLKFTGSRESIENRLKTSKSRLNLEATLAILDEDDEYFSGSETETDNNTTDGKASMSEEVEEVGPTSLAVDVPPPEHPFHRMYCELMEERELMEEKSLTPEAFSFTVQQGLQRCADAGEEGKAFVNKYLLQQVLPYIFVWASKMTSQEHRACIHLVEALCSHLPLFISVLAAISEKLVTALRFLIAVSPQPQCPRTKTKRIAIDCSKILIEHGLATAEQFREPFYGNDLPLSSAYKYLAHLPDELEKKWEEYWEQATDKAKAWMTTTDAKAAMLRVTTKEKGYDTPGAIEDIVEWDMFKITGEGHPPPKVWGKWGEVDGEDTLLDERIATANVILKAPRTEMVRLDLVMDMHKCFNVDDDVSKAQFRQDVTVGSYQFYAQYRCFLPHQEIAKAMSHMVETFNTEHMRSLHPIVQAFYLYSAVVYYIHPYEDGNGRMARLLSNLILKKYGFEFALDYTDKVLSFKEYIKKVLDASSES